MKKVDKMTDAELAVESENLAAAIPNNAPKQQAGQGTLSRYVAIMEEQQRRGIAIPLKKVIDMHAFQDSLELYIKKSDTDGITKDSLFFAKKWLRLIGKPVIVFLLYQAEPWEFLTYVIDEKGFALRFSGFGWGYGGEGAHGLTILLGEILGWKVPASAVMPPAHTPGIWAVQPDGSVVDYLPLVNEQEGV